MVFLRNYERALMAELRHELRRGLDIHRAFARLPNARVDRLLSILARDALRGTILRWGDIDYPSPAFYKSLKRAPPLSCLRPLATQVSSCLADSSACRTWSRWSAMSCWSAPSSHVACATARPAVAADDGRR